MWDGTVVASGSSPLARGLRRRIHGGPRPRPDHPRSRGVYASRQAGRSSAAGSSPLARGLLYLCGKDWRAARIIPARAGFTQWAAEAYS